MEVARGLSELLAAGWVPRRTLMLCSWDGEEHGMLGSTAWAEQHAEMLASRAVAYVNVDSAVSGPNVAISATPSLARFAADVLAEVDDPATGRPLSESFVSSGR